MRIGILTGSGTHVLPGVQDASPHTVQTRYGPAHLTTGRWQGNDIVHLSRHGEGHARLSNQVNHRANVLALRELEVDAALAVTICGAVDAELALGSLIVFDDLHFLVNRLADGSICSLHDRPEVPGRGHWVFGGPFSEPLRGALLQGARTAQLPVRDSGCYGHVDGPRFNTRAEIRMLAACGVSAVSQTAGPETVLCGEAEIPYALLGYVTDYANGAMAEPTPVSELTRLMAKSAGAFSATLEHALGLLQGSAPATTGTHIRFA